VVDNKTKEARIQINVVNNKINQQDEEV